MTFSRIEKGKQRTPPARCGRCGKTKGAAPRPGYQFPLCPKCHREMDDAARAAVFGEAVSQLGPNAVLGRGHLLQNGTGETHYVGVRHQGRFAQLGTGASYGEALANVRRVLLHVPREKIVYAPEVAP